MAGRTSRNRSRRCSSSNDSRYVDHLATTGKQIVIRNFELNTVVHLCQTTDEAPIGDDAPTRPDPAVPEGKRRAHSPSTCSSTVRTACSSRVERQPLLPSFGEAQLAQYQRAERALDDDEELAWEKEKYKYVVGQQRKRLA